MTMPARTAQAVQSVGILTLFAVLLFVFVVAHAAPLWVLQVLMLIAVSGALAWPPRTFRHVSGWALWAAVVVSIVLRFVP